MKLRAWLAAASFVALAGLLAGCSRPRDRYADELKTRLDAVYASLQRYRSDPQATDDSRAAISDAGGTAGARFGSPVAVAVGAGTHDLVQSLETPGYADAQDIRKADGYEAWAGRTARELRERADRCLRLLAEIRREYEKDPNSDRYRSRVMLNGVPAGGFYRTVWRTPEGNLVFAMSPASNEGIAIEVVLKSDFRRVLDGIHTQH